MLSAQPALTPAELRSALLAGARPFPTSGAGNDENGQPVPMCRAPDGSDQLQCYCSVGLCGAGMVDALGAVTAARSTIARIELEPAAVQPGDNLRLSAAGSLAGVGRGIVAYAWSLIDGGGVVSGFAGASNAAEAFVVPSGAGSFVVQLSVVDDGGGQSSVQRSVTVAAPLPPVAAPVPATPAGSGGGGVVDVVGAAAGIGGRFTARQRSGFKTLPAGPCAEAASIIAAQSATCTDMNSTGRARAPALSLCSAVAVLLATLVASPSLHAALRRQSPPRRHVA